MRIKKLAVAIVLALLTLCFWTSWNGAASSVTAYINRNTYVYARPSTSSAKVRVATGPTVTVLAVRGSGAQSRKGKAKG